MLELLLEQTGELKKQIEMLDALFKHATEGIIVVDAEGEITMANPTAARMFGYTEDALVGEKIEILIPRRLAGRHQQHREEFVQNPHARSMGMNLDLKGLRRDGTSFPVEVSLSPFRTSSGQFVVSFIVDITERKRQEDAIIKAHEEIRKLNMELEERVAIRTTELAKALDQLNESKLEVTRALEKERELNDMKSKFVTIASHEFRTPLATVLSSASLIGRYVSTEDDDKRQKHVGRIKSAVNNLTEILNDFLSLSRLEEGLSRFSAESFSLVELSRQLSEELRLICKDGQHIIHSHVGDEIAYTDKQIIRNLSINLLSNAIKYSSKDLFFRTSIQDDVLTIEIEDQGIGIPESDIPYLFDRFFRAQNAGAVQGTGLGLNIVKKYIELIRGEVKVTSQLNVGTTVTVSVRNSSGK